MPSGLSFNSPLPIFGSEGVFNRRRKTSSPFSWSLFFGSSAMINPAFLNYPEEARLLGELVLGYGELDISFCMMCGIATQRQFELLHAVNQVRSESARLDIANALSVDAFAELGLSREYARTHKAVRFCLKVRNQWAHSQWGDLSPHGLAFTKTDGDVFARPLKRTVWNSITADLLRKQEAFFEYTRHCILTVEMNLRPILDGRKPKFDMRPEMHEPNMKNQWSKSARVHLSKLPQHRA